MIVRSLAWLLGSLRLRCKVLDEYKDKVKQFLIVTWPIRLFQAGAYAAIPTSILQERVEYTK
jgi:hypothetical protein